MLYIVKNYVRMLCTGVYVGRVSVFYFRSVRVNYLLYSDYNIP